MEVDVNEVACNKAIEGAFNLADASKKGYLARKEYKIAVTALLGYKPSKLECERVLSEHGSSKVLEDGSTVKIIPFVTFKVLMVPKIYQRDSDELIRQIFHSSVSAISQIVTIYIITLSLVWYMYSILTEDYSCY